MRLRTLMQLSVMAVGVMGVGSAAQAVTVSYITTGTFSGGDLPGSSRYLDAANGIDIVFDSSIGNDVEVPPASQVSFGRFNTSATTTPNLRPVGGTFTLTITQLSPEGGEATFVGSLTGSIATNNSQLFVVFPDVEETIGAVFYRIVNNDQGTPGRVNIAPPTTNNGLTTINGLVGVVPEPASLLLIGLGAPALLVASRRRRAAA